MAINISTPYCVLFFVVFCLYSVRLQAQKSLAFHQLSTKDLTSQNNNYQIFYDAAGCVWISSFDGLNKFNGFDVRQYVADEEDSLSIADVIIESSFFSDSLGNFWVGSMNALNYYDQNSDGFMPYYFENSLGGYHEILAYDDRHKELWITQGKMLLIFSMKTQSIVQQVDTISHHWGRQIKLITDNQRPLSKLTYGIKGGWKSTIYHNKKKIEEYNYIEDSSATSLTKALYHLNFDTLLVGTTNGLFLEHSTGKFRSIPLFRQDTIRDIVGIQPLDSTHLVIASKEQGLFLFNLKTFSYEQQLLWQEEEEQIIFPYPIERLFVGPDQMLWIHAIGQGVFYANLKKQKFTTLSELPNGQVITNVTALQEDEENQLWMITPTGLHVYEHKQIDQIACLEQQNKGYNYSSNYYNFLEIDQQKCIWTRSNDGFLYTLDNSCAFQTAIKVEGSAPAIFGFSYVNQLSNGRIIVSTAKNGLWEIRSRRIPIILQRLPECTDSSKYTLTYETKAGFLLCSKLRKSIEIFKVQADELAHLESISFESEVNGFVEDKTTNRVWIASSNGLFKLDLSSFKLIPVGDLPTTSLKGILQDSLGHLWMSSNVGLLKYYPKKDSCRLYTEADGLQDLEFNEWVALERNNGDFVFGGVNGLNIFNPYEIEDILVEAKPSIVEIRINDGLAMLTCEQTGATNPLIIKEVELPSDSNTLSFQFAPLEYSDPSSNEYQYKMIGIDNDWVLSGTKNFTRYANLNPGKYTFLLNATNSDGHWAKKYKELAITILPPWYFTPFAKFIWMVLTVGTGYLLYRLQIDQVKRKEEAKRKEVEYERTVAENKRVLAETENAVLRLQMNPHFIFNSMNSISRYILEKDIDTANDYLMRFSKLTRSILKFAAEQFIIISDEIDLLKQYLDTEKMRLGKQLNYEFILDDRIDPDEYVIPTMILQPFVENAIWHGIRPKQGEGAIQIGFKIKENQLFCFVEDNGIGRKAAKEKRSSKHDSKALKITQQRLDNLAKEEQQPAFYEIIDLVEETSGKAKGTRVELWLPLLE